MSDLIKREDAIKALYKYSFVSKDIIEREINAIPSADVDISKYSDKLWKNAYERGKADRPQGEWIDMGDFEKCSVCKGTHLKEFQSYYGKVIWIQTPYCPNCGCRMKGADDE